VLRSFRAVAAKTTLTAADWTPREMRHSFVSLLSDSGVPVLLGGAEAMDRIFTPLDGRA
jgi:hypothetical protein